jgi:hypothetical protein
VTGPNAKQQPPRISGLDAVVGDTHGFDDFQMLTMPVANCNDSVASSRSSAARRSEPGDPPCQIVPKPNSSMASAMAGSRSLTPRQTPTAPRRLLQVMLVLPDSQEPQLCAGPRPVRRRPIRSLRQELVNSAANPADPTYDRTARNRQTRRRKPLARRRHISANEASRCKRWCVERALTLPPLPIRHQ